MHLVIPIGLVVFATVGMVFVLALSRSAKKGDEGVHEAFLAQLSEPERSHFRELFSA